MHLLIDSDSLLYKAGFVANDPDQERLACYQLDVTIKGILERTSCSTFQCYISGKNNFRYNMYPEYKANRKNMVRPVHLEVLKYHIIHEWGATVTDGNEADDVVGIMQCSTEGSCIAHIDKDIDQIPGEHYNYNKNEFYLVSNEQGMRHFYFQLIMGDKTDNIPGFDGKMRPKVPNFLLPDIEDLDLCSCPEEMLKHVSGMWLCDEDKERWEQFNSAAWCLWMQRKEYDDWRNYLDNNLMEGLGLPVDLIRSLPAPYELPADAGLLNIKP